MFLPLTNNPEESFNISIDDLIYTFRQLWNEYGFWTIDVSNADGVILVYGVKIITKELILKQYSQIPFDLISDNEFDPARLTLDSFLLDVVDK